TWKTPAGSPASRKSSANRRGTEGPGPTWPNRFFAHAATSRGYLDNRLHNYDMRSIFENLSDQGYTWGNYFHDASQTMFLQRLRTDGLEENFLPFTRFVSDAKRGQLPNYSFIEPQYFSFLSEANDQHPPHDVQAGERLIATVYNAVRSSPLWKKSMLLVTYDEHGGTYDHVPPERATPPDGNTAQFAFDRYGVRVPAVVISPYVRKGHIEHRVFDHTSIPATLKSIFKLKSFLTRRDAAANTFASIASLGAPRTDVPSNVALPAARDRPVMDDELLDANMAMKAKVAARTSTAPLTDLQKALVSHAHTLDVDETPQLRALRMARRVESEYDAAVYVREVTARYLAKKSSGSSRTPRPRAPGTALKEAAPRKTPRASKKKRVVKKTARKR
ncbi:MAG: alkaline phosphatase family protein, partial [Burkholderiales bacterium]